MLLLLATLIPNLNVLLQASLFAKLWNQDVYKYATRLSSI